MYVSRRMNKEYIMEFIRQYPEMTPTIIALIYEYEIYHQDLIFENPYVLNYVSYNSEFNQEALICNRVVETDITLVINHYHGAYDIDDGIITFSADKPHIDILLDLISNDWVFDGGFMVGKDMKYKVEYEIIDQITDLSFEETISNLKWKYSQNKQQKSARNVAQ